MNKWLAWEGVLEKLDLTYTTLILWSTWKGVIESDK